MSGKVRQRTAANAADSSSQSVNEKILKECHTLYTDPENGKSGISLLLQKIRKVRNHAGQCWLGDLGCFRKILWRSLKIIIL